ncbi:MAG: hypothetical protein KA270_02615 [Saprospiraceae bacterium]|jgi:hypothetical protein|nr:hypothetical protein [Saprospiraceae bacterium]MBP6566029.1 hypothetical protein [Saprospiraceae bacterium]
MKIISFSSVYMITLMVILVSSCASKKNIPNVIPSVVEKYDIAVQPIFAEVDNLGRLYVLDDKNRIINYKPDLTEQYRFANTRSGQVTTLDVTNPLKVVAFYDDFNQVKVLDNTLSIINELNLADKFADISACGVTNDGHLWVFDPVQFKLIKINDSGVKVMESSNVNDFGMVDVKITDIREKGNFVVLCDRNKGFYIFDNLGQYLYFFESKDIKSFQFDGRNIYYYTSTGLKSYSVKFKERLILGVPIDVNKSGLKYILYNAGEFIEVNQNGLNVIRSKAKK